MYLYVLLYVWIMMNVDYTVNITWVRTLAPQGQPDPVPSVTEHQQNHDYRHRFTLSVPFGNIFKCALLADRFVRAACYNTRETDPLVGKVLEGTQKRRFTSMSSVEGNTRGKYFSIKLKNYAITQSIKMTKLPKSKLLSRFRMQSEV